MAKKVWQSDSDAWGEFWDRKRKKYLSWRSQGRCVIWRVGQRLMVVCPQDEAFRVLATTDQYRGKFRPRTALWTFPLASSRALIELAGHLWGVDKVTVSNTGEPT